MGWLDASLLHTSPVCQLGTHSGIGIGGLFNGKVVILDQPILPYHTYLPLLVCATFFGEVESIA